MSRTALIVLGCVAFIALVIAGMFYSISRFQAQNAPALASPADWLGEWATVTCRNGESFAWTVTFVDQEGALLASYTGAEAKVADRRGTIRGEAVGPVFAGTWQQTTAPENQGRITLEVFEGGTAFAGTYVNEATGAENRWLGRKGGEVPECG